MEEKIRVKNKLFHNTNYVCVASIVTAHCLHKHCIMRNKAISINADAGMRKIMKVWKRWYIMVVLCLVSCLTLEGGWNSFSIPRLTLSCRCSMTWAE